MWATTGMRSARRTASLEDEIIEGLPKSDVDRCTRPIRASCSTFGPTEPQQRTSNTSLRWRRHTIPGCRESQFRNFAGDLSQSDHCGSGREPATEIRLGRRRLEAVAQQRLVCRSGRGRQAEVRPVRESSRTGCSGVDAHLGLKPYGDLQLTPAERVAQRNLVHARSCQPASGASITGVARQRRRSPGGLRRSRNPLRGRRCRAFVCAA